VAVTITARTAAWRTNASRVAAAIIGEMQLDPLTWHNPVLRTSTTASAKIVSVHVRSASNDMGRIERAARGVATRTLGAATALTMELSVVVDTPAGVAGLPRMMTQRRR
jgi:hypothetical protein